MLLKLVFRKTRWMLRPNADRPCMLPAMKVNLLAGRCEHEGCNTIATQGRTGAFATGTSSLAWCPPSARCCSDSGMRMQRH